MAIGGAQANSPRPLDRSIAGPYTSDRLFWLNYRQVLEENVEHRVARDGDAMGDADVCRADQAIATRSGSSGGDPPRLSVWIGAPLPMQFSVVQSGLLLMARSEVERIHYEAWVSSMHLDFAPSLRLFEASVLAGIA